MSTQPTDKVTIELHPNDLQNLRNILEFGLNWLPRSQAPAIDVTNVVGAVQGLLPQLVAKEEDKPTLQPVDNVVAES